MILAFYRETDVLFQLKIGAASEKFNNQPRPLLRPRSVHFRQHFWNLSHETVPLNFDFCLLEYFVCSWCKSNRKTTPCPPQLLVFPPNGNISQLAKQSQAELKGSSFLPSLFQMNHLQIGYCWLFEHLAFRFNSNAKLLFQQQKFFAWFSKFHRYYGTETFVMSSWHVIALWSKLWVKRQIGESRAWIENENR